MSDDAKAVQDFIDWEAWQRQALTESFNEMTEHHKLYFGQRKDPRKAHEKSWRSFTCTPKPFIAATSQAATECDIINSSDPPIQAVGIGDEDQEVAKKVERLLEMTLNVNKWAARSYDIALEKAVQGTSAFKIVWRNDVMRVKAPVGPLMAEFDSAIKELADKGVEAPSDPAEYEAWRAEADQDGMTDVLSPGEDGMPRPLPQHPSRASREVTLFKGPAIERVSMQDLRFDPLEPVWSRQRRISQRIIKPRSWLFGMTGPGPDKPFDPKAVEDALSGLPENALNQWQSEIATMCGLASAATGFPGRSSEDLVEIFEEFNFEDPDEPWKVILNRKRVINKERVAPYGYNPIHLIRHLPFPGMALGQSLLKAPRRLFEELQVLRDLRLDGVTLATLPVFRTLFGLGIPDISKVFRPGAGIPLPSGDAISKLDLGNGVHPDTWREIDAINFEIDDATSTYSSVRGAPSTVGRVSAAESSQRASSAMLRNKISALLFETEMREPIRQIVACWYMNSDGETIIKAGGPGADSYVKTINPDELQVALDMDFQFRGPSRAMNREMQTQQALQWYQTFGMNLKPHKQLAFARQVYQLQGLKAGQEIISDEDLKQAEQEYLQQQQAAAMAQQAAATPPPQEAPAQEAPAQEQAEVPPQGMPEQTMPMMQPPA